MALWSLHPRLQTRWRAAVSPLSASMGALGLRSAVSVAHAGHTSVHALSWRAYGPHLDTLMHVPRPVWASTVFTGDGFLRLQPLTAERPPRPGTSRTA